MLGRRRRSGTGLTPAGAALSDALTDLLVVSKAIVSRGSANPQRIIEALRGPLASRLVALDKSTYGNRILTVAGLLDSAELMSLRLELGGDAAEELIYLGGTASHLPHQCIMAKATRCMEVCLAAGADPNARDWNGWTPLHYAAFCMMAKHRESVQRKYGGPSGNEQEWADVEAMLMTLKAHGADISLTDAEGSCAIVKAVQLEQIAMAETLINVFASEPGSQHSEIRFAAIVRAFMAAETALEQRGREEGMDQAALCRKARDLALLLVPLERGWRPGGFGDERGKPGAHEPLQVAALAEAALKCSAAMTLGWLCKAADAEAVRLAIPGQRPPLVHAALQAELPHMVCALVAGRTDLSLLDERGQTALHRALQLRRKDFTQQLLEHAPQEQLVRLLTHDDGEGLTALGFCVARDRPEELPLLLRACERAGLGVSGLLERHAARMVNHLPVFAAVVEGRLGVLEQLLAAGLDPESPACRQHVGTSEEMGGSDATYVAQPSERTETLTLLMCAASTGDLRAVRLLLAAGADARRFPAGNRRFPDAVTMVLRGLRLEAPPPELERPDAEIAALAEPWLRNWQQEALQGACGAKLHDLPEPSEALVKWLEEWGGDAGVGERFLCLLLLLWHGAALARRQVGELLALLDLSGKAEEEGLAGAALENFLFERASQCGCCGLVGRWRRCECKRVWYCSRACQKQHWKAGHERECPLAQR